MNEVETITQVVVLDDTLQVPNYVLPVLESLMLADFDSRRERCGEAIRWLKDRGFVSAGLGRKKPVRITVAGRAFGRAAGFAGMEFQ